ncbi:hypothetical protein PSPO01_09968 [Paraphaeosphaeria sporulosa]
MGLHFTARRSGRCTNTTLSPLPSPLPSRLRPTKKFLFSCLSAGIPHNQRGVHTGHQTILARGLGLPTRLAAFLVFILTCFHNQRRRIYPGAGEGFRTTGPLCLCSFYYRRGSPRWRPFESIRLRRLISVLCSACACVKRFRVEDSDDSMMLESHHGSWYDPGMSSHSFCLSLPCPTPQPHRASSRLESNRALGSFSTPLLNCTSDVGVPSVVSSATSAHTALAPSWKSLSHHARVPGFSAKLSASLAQPADPCATHASICGGHPDVGAPGLGSDVGGKRRKISKWEVGKWSVKNSLV